MRWLPSGLGTQASALRSSWLSRVEPRESAQPWPRKLIALWGQRRARPALKGKRSWKNSYGFSPLPEVSSVKCKNKFFTHSSSLLPDTLGCVYNSTHFPGPEAEA